jgi:hypothetical protein
MLTIHNVVRILARPKVWPEAPAASDPAQRIFLDLRGTAGIDGKPLPDLLGIRKNPVNAGDWTTDALFAPKSGPFQTQPGAEEHAEAGRGAVGAHLRKQLRRLGILGARDPGRAESTAATASCSPSATSRSWIRPANS